MLVGVSLLIGAILSLFSRTSSFLLLFRVMNIAVVGDTALADVLPPPSPIASPADLRRDPYLPYRPTLKVGAALLQPPRASNWKGNVFTTPRTKSHEEDGDRRDGIAAEFHEDKMDNAMELVRLKSEKAAISAPSSFTSNSATRQQKVPTKWSAWMGCHAGTVDRRPTDTPRSSLVESGQLRRPEGFGSLNWTDVVNDLTLGLAGLSLLLPSVDSPSSGHGASSSLVRPQGNGSASTTVGTTVDSTSQASLSVAKSGDEPVTIPSPMYLVAPSPTSEAVERNTGRINIQRRRNYTIVENSCGTNSFSVDQLGHHGHFDQSSYPTGYSRIFPEPRNTERHALSTEQPLARRNAVKQSKGCYSASNTCDGNDDGAIGSSNSRSYAAHGNTADVVGKIGAWRARPQREAPISPQPSQAAAAAVGPRVQIPRLPLGRDLVRVARPDNQSRDTASRSITSATAASWVRRSRGDGPGGELRSETWGIFGDEPASKGPAGHEQKPTPRNWGRESISSQSALLTVGLFSLSKECWPIDNFSARELGSTGIRTSSKLEALRGVRWNANEDRQGSKYTRGSGADGSSSSRVNGSTGSLASTGIGGKGPRMSSKTPSGPKTKCTIDVSSAPRASIDDKIHIADQDIVSQYSTSGGATEVGDSSHGWVGISSTSSDGFSSCSLVVSANQTPRGPRDSKQQQQSSNSPGTLGIIRSSRPCQTELPQTSHREEQQCCSKASKVTAGSNPVLHPTTTVPLHGAIGVGTGSTSRRRAIDTQVSSTMRGYPAKWGCHEGVRAVVTEKPQSQRHSVQLPVPESYELVGNETARRRGVTALGGLENADAITVDGGSQPLPTYSDRVLGKQGWGGSSFDYPHRVTCKMDRELSRRACNHLLQLKTAVGTVAGTTNGGASRLATGPDNVATPMAERGVTTDSSVEIAMRLKQRLAEIRCGKSVSLKLKRGTERPLDSQRYLPVANSGIYMWQPTSKSGTLGSGYTSTVHKGIDIRDLSEVAVKVVPKEKQRVLASESYYRRLYDRLLKVMHPNLLHVHAVLETPSEFFVISEVCTGGDLVDYVLKYEPGVMPEPEIRVLLYQILSALGHLHSVQLLHRDVKLDNILFADRSHCQIRLLDFDMCQMQDTEEPPKPLSSPTEVSVVGTKDYMAPECYRGQYSAASDLWSVGVILFIFLGGHFPFDLSKTGNSHRAIREAMKRGARLPPALERRFPQAVDLLHRLLVFDPQARLQSSIEALRHPWFMPVNTARLYAPALASKCGKQNRSTSASSDAPPSSARTSRTGEEAGAAALSNRRLLPCGGALGRERQQSFPGSPEVAGCSTPGRKSRGTSSHGATNMRGATSPVASTSRVMAAAMGNQSADDEACCLADAGLGSNERRAALATARRFAPARKPGVATRRVAEQVVVTRECRALAGKNRAVISVVPSKGASLGSASTAAPTTIFTTVAAFDDTGERSSEVEVDAAPSGACCSSGSRPETARTGRCWRDTEEGGGPEAERQSLPNKLGSPLASPCTRWTPETSSVQWNIEQTNRRSPGSGRRAARFEAPLSSRLESSCANHEFSRELDLFEARGLCEVSRAGGAVDSTVTVKGRHDENGSDATGCCASDLVRCTPGHNFSPSVARSQVTAKLSNQRSSADKYPSVVERVPTSRLIRATRRLATSEPSLPTTTTTPSTPTVCESRTVGEAFSWVGDVPVGIEHYYDYISTTTGNDCRGGDNFEEVAKPGPQESNAGNRREQHGGGATVDSTFGWGSDGTRTATTAKTSLRSNLRFSKGADQEPLLLRYFKGYQENGKADECFAGISQREPYSPSTPGTTKDSRLVCHVELATETGTEALRREASYLSKSTYLVDHNLPLLSTPTKINNRSTMSSVDGPASLAAALHVNAGNSSALASAESTAAQRGNTKEKRVAVNFGGIPSSNRACEDGYEDCGEARNGTVRASRGSATVVAGPTESEDDHTRKATAEVVECKSSKRSLVQRVRNEDDKSSKTHQLEACSASLFYETPPPNASSCSCSVLQKAAATTLTSSSVKPEPEGGGGGRGEQCRESATVDAHLRDSEVKTPATCEGCSSFKVRRSTGTLLLVSNYCDGGGDTFTWKQQKKKQAKLSDNKRAESDNDDDEDLASSLLAPKLVVKGNGGGWVPWPASARQPERSGKAHEALVGAAVAGCAATEGVPPLVETQTPDSSLHAVQLDPMDGLSRSGLTFTSPFVDPWVAYSGDRESSGIKPQVTGEPLKPDGNGDNIVDILDMPVHTSSRGTVAVPTANAEIGSCCCCSTSNSCSRSIGTHVKHESCVLERGQGPAPDTSFFYGGWVQSESNVEATLQGALNHSVASAEASQLINPWDIFEPRGPKERRRRSEAYFNDSGHVVSGAAWSAQHGGNNTEHQTYWRRAPTQRGHRPPRDAVLGLLDDDVAMAWPTANGGSTGNCAMPSGHVSASWVPLELQGHHARAVPLELQGHHARAVPLDLAREWSQRYDHRPYIVTPSADSSGKRSSSGDDCSVQLPPFPKFRHSPSCTFCEKLQQL